MKKTLLISTAIAACFNTANALAIDTDDKNITSPVTSSIETTGNIDISSDVTINSDEEEGIVQQYADETLQSSRHLTITDGNISLSQGSGIYAEGLHNQYNQKSADINILGGNITITDGGEIDLVGTGNLNIEGGTILMDYANVQEDNSHDGGILHEGKQGNINLKGGTLNLTGSVAKIERSGYDGDWVYDAEGTPLFNIDELYNDNGSINTEKYNAAVEYYGQATVDGYLADGNTASKYHPSTGDINITGSTINLNNGAAIKMSSLHSGDINITKGAINASNPSADNLDYSTHAISHLGVGDINLSGGTVSLNSSDITKGLHNGKSNQLSGDVNISGNVNLFIQNDSHINAANAVNISGGNVTLTDGSIDSYGDLNISGGKITLYGDESGLSSHLVSGNVNVTGGDITLNGTSGMGRGANFDSDFDLNDFGDKISGDVNISGSKITINNNSALIAGRISEELNNIKTEHNINISDKADITLNDNARLGLSAFDMQLTQDADVSGALNILGGKVALNDEASLVGDYFSSKIKVSGGTVNLTGEETHMGAKGGVEIAGGTVNLSGESYIHTGAWGPNPSDPDAPISLPDGALTISGGQVNSGAGTEIVTGQEGKYDWKALDLNITGGNIKLTNAQIEALSSSDINISNGTINSSVSGAQDEARGIIHSGRSGDINITGGNLTLSGQSNIQKSGILRSGYNDDGLERAVQAEYLTLAQAQEIEDHEDDSPRNLLLSNLYDTALAEGDINIKGGDIILNSGASIAMGEFTLGDINITGGNLTLNQNSTIEHNNLLHSEDKTGDINIKGSNTQVVLNGTSQIITGGREEDYDLLENTAFVQNNVLNTAHMSNSAAGNTTFNLNQDPHTNIRISDGALVTMNGSSKLQMRSASDGDIIVKDGGKISVKGINSITGNTMVDGGSIDIASSARLTVRDFDDELDDETLTRTSINLKNQGAINLAGRLDTDVIDQDGSGILNWQGSSARVDGDIIDLGNLNFDAQNLTFNQSNLFKVTSDQRQYASAAKGKTKILVDQTDADIEEDGSIDIEYDYTSAPVMHDYENQVKGNVNVTGGSKLTIASNFAASAFNVDNASTLTFTDALLGADSVLVDNGSTLNLNRKNTEVESGITQSLVLDHGSTLNLNQSLELDAPNEYGQHSNTDYINVLNDSILNLNTAKDGVQLGTSRILVDNSALNANSSFVRTRGSGVQFANHATGNFTNSGIYEDNIISVKDSTLSLKSSSHVNGVAAEFDHADITVDNSTLGAFKHAIEVSSDNKRISNEINNSTYLTTYDWDNENNQSIIVSRAMDLDIKNGSTLTLKGSSALGTSLAIIQNEKLIGHLTKANLQDPSTLIGKRIPEDENFASNLQNNEDITIAKANVNIDASTINLQGTSSIINGMLNTDDENYGNVNITGGSTINVSGNNTIQAGHSVVLDSSNLNINKGATLTIASDTATDNSGKELKVVASSLDEDGNKIKSNINLAGTLNADIDFGYNDDLTLALNGGKVNGTISKLSSLGIQSGSNGKTSSTMKGQSYSDLKDLTVSGAKTNITLDSSNTFKVTSDAKQYVYDASEKEYLDVNQDSQSWYDEDYSPQNYDNQIAGDLTVKEGATFNINKHFAADSINVDNAKLISNQALLSGDLHLSNNANATINGSNLGGLFLGDIDLQNSTLNLNSVEYMQSNGLTAHNSTINLQKWTEYYIGGWNENYERIGTLTLDNSKLIANTNDAWLNSPVLKADNSSQITAANAWMLFHSSDLKNSTILASKKSLLDLGNAAINNSTITLGDNTIAGSLFAGTDNYGDDDITQNITIADSVLNLNGNSLLTNEKARIKETSSGNDQYNGYVSANDDDREYEAGNLHGGVAINNSTVNMSGKSTIASRLFDYINEDYSDRTGYIDFASSTINVKGTNALTATYAVNFIDSTLDVSKGATLTLSDNYINNSSVILNGNLRTELLSLAEDSILKLNGGRLILTGEDNIQELDNLYIGENMSGKTSKLMSGALYEADNITISGTELASGKLAAPKLTLDSAVFTGNNIVEYYIDPSTKIPQTADYMNESNREELKPKPYTNITDGTINIKNGATLTVNSHLAAKKVAVDNGTFNVSGALFYGNLDLQNRSLGNFTYSKDYILRLPELTVDNSTLKIKATDILSTSVDIKNSSEVTLNKTYSGLWRMNDFKLTGSKLTSSEVDLTSNGDTLAAKIDNSTINATISGAWKFDTADIARSTLSFTASKPLSYAPKTVDLGTASIEESTINIAGAAKLGGALTVNGHTSLNLSGTAQLTGLLDSTSPTALTFNIGTTISASGTNKLEGSALNFNDAILNVANGATLTAKTYDGSQTGKTITFNGGSLKLGGTLNANVTGTLDTLVLGTKGRINGDTSFTGLNSFGIIGITKNADLTKALTTFTSFGGNTSAQLQKFVIADKSNLTYNNQLKSILPDFKDMRIENATLSVKDTLDVGHLVSQSGATVKINSGAVVNAKNTEFCNSAVTISGAAKKKGETTYSTVFNSDHLIIDNESNAKSAVSITNAWLKLPDSTPITSEALTILDVINTTLKNVDLNGSLLVENTHRNKAKLTLTGVTSDSYAKIADTASAALSSSTFLGDLSITSSSEPTKDKKGNLVYNTTSLTGITAQTLNLSNTKATLNKNNSFTNINAGDTSYLDLKDNLSLNLLKLTDTSAAALASKKTLTGDVTLSEDATFALNGTIDGSVAGSGTLSFNNKNAYISGSISDIKLSFNKVSNSLSKMLGGSAITTGATTLNNSTITADASALADFGALALNKSTLTLRQNMSADSLVANASTLNLGTYKLSVDGLADLTNKSTVALNVNDASTYGQLSANAIKVAAADKKGNPTINLKVTLKKGINLDNDTQFKFLDYNYIADGSGKLKTTITNNRFEFTETDLGQFTVNQTKSGKGVIKAYSGALHTTALNAAHALVDSSSPLGSAKQTALSIGADALSQVVGGEQDFIQALNAASPDDTGMVAQNTLANFNELSDAVNARTSIGGISNTSQGMSSGDEISGSALWTKMLYNRGKLDDNASHSGFRTHNSGLAFGADKHMTDSIELGLGFAYTKGDIKNDCRKSDVKSYTAVVYGEYKPSDWFVNAQLSYGFADYDTKASSLLGTTKADFDVYAAALQLNTGYDIHFGQTTLTPYGGMRYVNIHQSSYRDSDDKRISSADSDIVTLLAGARLAADFRLNDRSTITPELSFGAGYDLQNDSSNNVVTLANNSSYMIETRAMKRFSFTTGAGITASLNDNWELSTGYEGRFRADYQDHTGMLNVKYKF